MILYSIYITDADGYNGRWMMDSKRAGEVWTGTKLEAELQAEKRIRLFKQYQYTAKKYATNDSARI